MDEGMMKELERAAGLGCNKDDDVRRAEAFLSKLGAEDLMDGVKALWGRFTAFLGANPGVAWATHHVTSDYCTAKQIMEDVDWAFRVGDPLDAASFLSGSLWMLAQDMSIKMSDAAEQTGRFVELMGIVRGLRLLLGHKLIEGNQELMRTYAIDACHASEIWGLYDACPSRKRLKAYVWARAVSRDMESFGSRKKRGAVKDSTEGLRIDLVSGWDAVIGTGRGLDAVAVRDRDGFGRILFIPDRCALGFLLTTDMADDRWRKAVAGLGHGNGSIGFLEPEQGVRAACLIKMLAMRAAPFDGDMLKEGGEG